MTDKNRVCYTDPKTAKEENERILVVNDLTEEATEEQLQDYFSKYGEINCVVLKIDMETGKPMGYAFIEFVDKASISEVFASGDHYINNSKVKPQRFLVAPKKATIMVTGLTKRIRNKDILKHFSKFGKIEELKRPIVPATYTPESYCYITFSSEDEILYILRNPKRYIKDRELFVRQEVEEPTDTEPEQQETNATEPEQQEANAIEPEQEANTTEPDQNETIDTEPEQQKINATEPEQEETNLVIRADLVEPTTSKERKRSRCARKRCKRSKRRCRKQKHGVTRRTKNKKEGVLLVQCNLETSLR